MRDRLIELCDEKICTMKFQNSDHWFDFTEKIKEIADYLLANGVIVPPCKVGDEVYYVFEGEVRELTVISFSYMFSKNLKHFNLHTTNYRGAVLSYESKDIGKTVFLTKEEAEQAIKEREG